MSREESLAEGSWLCREEACGGWWLCFGTQIWGAFTRSTPAVAPQPPRGVCGRPKPLASLSSSPPGQQR